MYLWSLIKFIMVYTGLSRHEADITTLHNQDIYSISSVRGMLQAITTEIGVNRYEEQAIQGLHPSRSLLVGGGLREQYLLL